MFKEKSLNLILFTRKWFYLFLLEKEWIFKNLFSRKYSTSIFLFKEKKWCLQIYLQDKISIWFLFTKKIDLLKNKYQLNFYLGKMILKGKGFH